MTPSISELGLLTNVDLLLTAHADAGSKLVTKEVVNSPSGKVFLPGTEVASIDKNGTKGTRNVTVGRGAAQEVIPAVSIEADLFTFVPIVVWTSA